MKLKVIGPQKMMGKNIVVTHGEFKRGKSVDSHTDAGKEFTYILEGRCQFNQDGETLVLEAGDSIFHNARREHSIVGLEKFKFVSIYMKDKE